LTYIWAVETERVETPYGTFACLKGDFITANLRKFGAHQRSDLAAALGLIQRGDTVIDIGSHIGTYAIPFGRAVGPSGTVVAFEAMKDHLALLEQNIHDNGLDDVVEAVWAAVTMGDTPLRVEYIKGNSGATRLGGSAGMENSEIPLVGLDEWLDSTPSALQSIDLLKIDVEGMELDVLRSGVNLIEKFRPIIVFELSHHSGDEALLSELERFFVPRGYTFLVNLHLRNSRTDEFRLGRLGRLHKSELVGVGTIDVIAIQSGSPRFPKGSAGRLTTILYFLTRLSKVRLYKSKEKLRRGSAPLAR
jgi:FkbM family methyltransferase